MSLPLSVYSRKPGGLPWQRTWNRNSLYYDNLGNGIVTVPSVASIDDLTQFTWEAWVYCMGYVNLNRIFDKQRKLLFLNAATQMTLSVQAFAPGTNAAAITTEIPALNRWTHVLITYDDLGDRMGHIYRNIVEVSYVSNTALTGALWSEAGFALGVGNRTALARGWYGYIAEPRWFNRVLTAEERWASYRRGYAKVEAGCVLALRMNEGSGATLYDSSPSGNNGAIVGAVWRKNKLYELLAETGV